MYFLVILPAISIFLMANICSTVDLFLLKSHWQSQTRYFISGDILVHRSFQKIFYSALMKSDLPTFHFIAFCVLGFDAFFTFLGRLLFFIEAYYEMMYIFHYGCFFYFSTNNLFNVLKVIQLINQGRRIYFPFRPMSVCFKVFLSGDVICTCYQFVIILSYNDVSWV